MKRICVSKGRHRYSTKLYCIFVLDGNSMLLNKAGFYILNNANKCIIPKKVKAYCQKEKNNKKCPRRCKDDDGQDGICYERVCPQVSTCTDRGGIVLMVKKVSILIERLSLYSPLVQQQEWGGGQSVHN